MHCSAGIGRAIQPLTLLPFLGLIHDAAGTGVVCLAAHVVECVEKAREKDDRCHVTSEMLAEGLVLLRQQRTGMVQTMEQFDFAGKVGWLLHYYSVVCWHITAVWFVGTQLHCGLCVALFPPSLPPH